VFYKDLHVNYKINSSNHLAYWNFSLTICSTQGRGRQEFNTLNSNEIREGGIKMTTNARMRFEEESDEERDEIRKVLLKLL
jgi:hypothetical protein